MPLLILHLSDIHLKTHSDPVLSKIDKLAAAVTGQWEDFAGLAVLVTGDLAWSGQEDEYVIASDFIAQLDSQLRSRCNLDSIHWVFIPGNHDCDFGSNNKLRITLLRNPPSTVDAITEDDATVADACTVVQNNFFHFLTKRNAALADLKGKDRLRYCIDFTIVGAKIHVTCYNTAFLSQKEEKPGQLYFPMKLLVTAPSECDIAISMFHHPYNWLQPDNARAFRNHVENTSDLIMTGHEHEGQVYERRIAPGGEIYTYSEGGVLQDHASNRSAFNLLAVDLTTQS